ncbi:MAG: HAMP domain-containing protein, partial [Chloroflexales bacterium]|nr:HAMP domain-containing protein [Chloroflexales bacterium]
MALAPRQMRWQIAVASTLLIFVTLGGLAATLYTVTRDTYLRTLEAGVAGQAHLVATLAATLAPAAEDDHLDPLVDDLGRQLNARVTLINADGQILADSLLPRERYSDQRDRPEVQAALAGGQGETARHSTATGDDQFFVAVPFERADGTTGVARVGVPLATIASAQSRMGLTTLLAALLAAAVAVVLAVLIARQTTRPLRELGRMAEQLAAGDLEVQVPIPHGVEVAALAQSFNQMASRLRQQIDARAREQARLEAILATMDDGILILDGAGQITLANRAARQILPLTETLPCTLTEVPGGAPLVAAAQTVRDAPLASPTTLDELPLSDDRSLRALLTRLGERAPAQTLVVLQ